MMSLMACRLVAVCTAVERGRGSGEPSSHLPPSPIQLSGPLCSARLCTTSHEQSSAVLSPPSLLCAGSCKVCRCRAEELPLSRAETNSPPPLALTTVQSSAEQGGTEQSRAPTTVQESSTLLQNLPPLQSGLCRIKPGSRGLQSPSIQILLLPESQHARGKYARQQEFEPRQVKQFLV